MNIRSDYLVEGSSDGIFAFDNNVNLTTCNRAARDLLGISKSELRNQSIFELIKFLSVEEDGTKIKNVLAGESFYQKGKVYFDKKNNSYSYFDLEVSYVLDDDANIVGGMGLLRHIKKNKNTSTHLLDELSNSVKEILPKIVFDLEGKPIYFNDSYKQLWDITPKVEKYVYNHYNLFRDEQLLDFGIVAELKSQAPHMCLEMPLVKYDTKKTTLLRSLDLKQKTLTGYIHPRKNNNGKVEGIEITLIDLSENILEDKVYFDFYEKFQKLTINLPVVIYEFEIHPNGNSNFKYISKNCLEIFGISDIEIQRDKGALINQIHLDDIASYLQSVKKAQTEQSLWEWEGRFIVRGNEKWFRGTSRPEKRTTESTIRYGVLTDISAEKTALKNEGEIGKRLELALKGGDLGLWDWYLNSGKIVTNTRFQEIVGYSNEEIKSIDMGWIHHIHKDERAFVRDEMIKHVKGQSDFFDIEMRVKSSDNQWHWIHSRGQVTARDKNQKATRLTGTIQNVDQRKYNENALLENERKYRSLVEHSPLAITVHSEGKILFANEQAGKLLGVNNPQELIGREILDFVKEENRKTVTKSILSIYKHGQAGPMIEEKFIDVNGKEVIAEVVGIPYEYDGKQAIQLIARDITDKKKTEGVLKRSEQLLSQLFENVPIGIVLLDENRRVVQINKGFEGIFGYTNDEAFGERLNNLIIPKESRGEAINLTKLIAGGKVIKEVDSMRETKDGRLVPVMIYGLPVTLQDKVIAVYGIYVDMTASKNVEGELKVRNEELDNFVYKVSHDLRAPLSSTLGLIHLAKLEGKDADLRQYIQLIGDRVTQLDRFIADVLSHSKNLNQDVVNIEVDLEKIINDSFDELNYLPEAGTIDRKITIENHPFVNDHWRMSEVIRNLISNAIKYLNPKTTNPFIKIDISVDKKKCLIIFEDNGIGIAEDLQPKIFDMFYRATEYSQGSGIGLYIVKNAIEKMSGEITVESTLDVGTKFYITLPNN